MTMSYFVPDDQTVEFLSAAARRGVDVRLVLQGMSDSTLVLRAGQSYYEELIGAGVKIYERSDTLLHAKTTVIDGVWSSVGSSNVDWRSFLHNDEVNVIVFGAEFADEMEKLFQLDVDRAEPITLEEWEKRGILRRAQERFGRLFEYWL
jgi:cardiolipin synthase